jgi:hypothetical protein
VDRPHHRRRMLPTALVLTSLLALAGCAGLTAGLPTAALPIAAPAGASASPATVATNSGESGPSPVGSASAPSNDPAIAWPAFAACLRAHGIDVADPTIDDQGQPQFAPGVDLSSQVTSAIQAACGPIIAAVTATKVGKTYAFDSLVAHAACLRQHGLPNYPDPDPNAAMQRLAPGYSKSDRTVNAALVACGPLLVQTSPSASPSH